MTAPNLIAIAFCTVAVPVILVITEGAKLTDETRQEKEQP